MSEVNDGFALLRDKHGYAWVGYNAVTRTLRLVHRASRDLEKVADLSLDKLAAGDPQPISTFTRPRRS